MQPGPEVGLDARSPLDTPDTASDARVMNSPRLPLILCGWLLVAAAPATGQSALSEVALERTERMLENRLACLGCHVIGDEGGRIGPVLNGLSARVDEGYVHDILEDPAAVIPGTTMPHQPMADSDRDRLVAYLMTLQPRSDAAAGPAEAAPALPAGAEHDGVALYARHCAACHGTEGRGDGWNAANLPTAPTAHADAESMGLRPDDTLFDAIYAGGFVLDKSARMPAFGRLLDTEQIRALVAHIRTLCACEQPAWAGGAQ